MLFFMLVLIGYYCDVVVYSCQVGLMFVLVDVNVLFVLIFVLIVFKQFGFDGYWCVDVLCVVSC